MHIYRYRNIRKGKRYIVYKYSKVMDKDIDMYRGIRIETGMDMNMNTYIVMKACIKYS